jgi:hypothetical protein
MKNNIISTLLLLSLLFSQNTQPEESHSGIIDTLYHDVEDSIIRDCSFSVQQITQFNIPFTITNPGLYCLAPNVAINPTLTGRLVVSSGTGITINTSNVIIDFNDTILEGQGGATGIFINSGVQNIIIRNGTVRAMTSSGISINNGFNQLNGPIMLQNMVLTNNATGANISNAFNVIARNVQAYFSTTNGITINQATNCLFYSCVSNNNAINGFNILNSNSLIFSSCIADANTSNGFNITGLAGSQFLECTANRNQNGFFQTNGTVLSQNNSFENCFAAQNNNFGFSLVANQTNLKNCTSLVNNIGFLINGSNNTFATILTKNNNNIGFQLIGNNCQLQNCQSINNSNGFQINGNNNSILTGIAKINTGNGLQITGAGNEIQDFHAFNNGINGIIVNNNNNSVLNSVAKQNIGTGILLSVGNGFGPTATNSQIRNNTLTGNAIGINDQGTTNRVYANFANNNGTNFVGVPNVAVSPTILTPINFTANISE